MMNMAYLGQQRLFVHYQTVHWVARVGHMVDQLYKSYGGIETKSQRGPFGLRCIGEFHSEMCHQNYGRPSLGTKDNTDWSCETVLNDDRNGKILCRVVGLFDGIDKARALNHQYLLLSLVPN